MSDDVDQERQEAALAVWQAAVTAEGRPPGDTRVALIRRRLADPHGLLVTVDRSERVVGMGLAQPFRARHPADAHRAGWGHLSMVFVDPGHQGSGIGTIVVDRLTRMSPWPTLSLWTGEANDRAHRLYGRFGFAPTGERELLEDGRRIGRWERRRQTQT